ncbi:MAG: DUF1573 domain-containing protein [Sphingobacteriales bacterium]|nr:DUF1573 domain-containing protein [Sphingobacteriales bacterium]
MKSLIILTTLTIFSIGVFAQELTEVQFEKVLHNFGDIREENGPVSYDFRFTNVGKADFIISDLKASCGCTSPAYSKEPVKPGKTGFIRVTYDPTNKEGGFNETVTVTSNSKTKYQVSILGNVIPRPRTLLDDYPTVMGALRFKVHHVVMGEINRNSFDTGYIYAYNNSDKAVTIKYVSTPEHIRCDPTPIVIQPKEKKTIQVFYSTYIQQNLGYNFDRIQLVTDDAAYPEKEFIVVANVVNNYIQMTEEQLANAPKIEFDKKVHDFGTVKQGQILTTEFTFSNKGKDQLVIYDTKTNCGCTASTLNKMRFDPGESSIIKVTLDTKGKSGYIQQSVTVKTNDPNNPEVVLLLNARVEKL